MHKLNLKNGEARWLVLYLNAQGILNSVTEVFLVGTLLASHLDAANSLKKEDAEGDGWEKWSAEDYPEFEVTEKQRDIIKKVLEEVAKKGALAPNKFTVKLIETFGLQPA